MVIWLITTAGKTQSYTFQAGVGYGSYLMEDVRRLQDDYDASTPVTMKRTDNLGPSPYYDAQLRLLSKERYFFGLAYRKLSSGIRSVYEDYSGSLELRQQVSAECFGLLVGTALISKFPLRVNAGMEVYATWEQYELHAIEQYGGTPINEIHSTAEQQSFFANPFLEGSYHFGSWSATLKAGYTADPLSKDIKLDWTGWRVGLYAGYTF
jgi:hypothetical protein